MSGPIACVCPNGHRLSDPYRPSRGCRECRNEAALADAAALLVKAESSLSEDEARALVEGTTGSVLAVRQLRDWLAEHPDGLRSARSDCPAAAFRLIAAFEPWGVEVARPRCVDCQKPRKLPQLVDGGRVCMTCYLRRRAEPCSRCGEVRPVSVRGTRGESICPSCRTSDPSSWQPCGLCGEFAQRITTIDGVVVGRCCYVAPLLRCTVCGIRKGVRPHKARRPVCAECTRRVCAVCATCGLDAPIPEVDTGQPACARCRLRTPSPCSGCGTATVGRDRDGAARCPDCYRRPVRACGRCGRVRAIVRLARDGDPDLCGVCWKGPVMVCEGCGRVGPCRGERKGRMLCSYCRPVTPQACAHCGESRQPMAHWHEGPVCKICYLRALAAKDDCPKCGEHRRLRRYPGFEVPVCAGCAGQPATHVCEACGIEDCLYERGVCPRCVLRRRLGDLFGDEAQRKRTGLASLFDALVDASEPRAVLDWLLKRHKITDALARIGRDELKLSYETLDYLEPALGVRTARHLENLLAATGTLPCRRDPVLAATERWCDRFLVGIDNPEHAQLMRTYVRWHVLRPLRDKSRGALLTDSTGYSARARLKSIAAFLNSLTHQGRSLAYCRQADIDTWVASQPPHRSQPLRHFARWAAARKAMARLDVPTRRNHRPSVPADADGRWAVARRLLHEQGMDAADRVAGALAVIYAQPLHRIARLTTTDLTVGTDQVAIRLGLTAVELPEPLATHARDLLAQRSAASRKARVRDAGWLFPGVDPGRPITQQGLSRRLRRHGVRAGQRRLVALYQLAAEIPPALVADLLGVHRITADVWARLAGRTWSDYPEMRASEGGHRTAVAGTKRDGSAVTPTGQ